MVDKGSWETLSTVVWVIAGVAAAVVLLGILVVARSLWFVRSLSSDPDSYLEPGKTAPDDGSLCLTCAYGTRFPDCPNSFAGDSFAKDEGPLYCDDYSGI